MPSVPTTVASLRWAGIISSTEIVAAIDRYVLDPASGPYRFRSGHSIDIAAAVTASPEMPDMRRKLGPHEKVLRTAIATIIMGSSVMQPEAAG